MYFISKKVSLLILGITALACSRMMFLFFNDPEGPNLLIVMVMAIIIYFLSLTIYLFKPLSKNILQHFSLTGFQGLLLVIFTQVIIGTVFYFCLD